MRDMSGTLFFFLAIIAFLSWQLWTQKWSPEAQRLIHAQEQQRQARELAEKAEKAKERVERCAPIEKAQAMAAQAGRVDLAGPMLPIAKSGKKIEGCRRFEVDDCVYRSDLVLTIKRLNDSRTLDGLIKADKEQCSVELEFAKRFGIPALRAHLELVEEAVQQVEDDTRSELELSREDFVEQQDEW